MNTTRETAPEARLHGRLLAAVLALCTLVSPAWGAPDADSALKWRARRPRTVPAARHNAADARRSDRLRPVRQAVHLNAVEDDDSQPLQTVEDLEGLQFEAVEEIAVPSEAASSRSDQELADYSLEEGEILLEGAQAAELMLPEAAGDAEELPDPAARRASRRSALVAQPSTDAPADGDDCDDGCPHPNDPRYFRNLADISVDISDPGPERERLSDDASRCWTDSDGNRVSAMLTESDETGVRLNLDDGGERFIARADLAEADLRYLRQLPLECTLGDEPYQPRWFSETVFTWKASALCHKPLYFEQVAAERYGHSTGPISQPFLSAAHFFVSVPLLPYKMGIEPPCECIYPLGYYRPNSCAPYMIDPFPLSWQGGLLQAGAIAGGVLLIP